MLKPDCNILAERFVNQTVYPFFSVIDKTLKIAQLTPQVLLII